jgi:hypothetical protein
MRTEGEGRGSIKIHESFVFSGKPSPGDAPMERHMRTRVLILLSLLLFAGIAGYADNLAAVYVAAGAHAIIYLLHTIEVKLNRLLDHYGILVTDAEIARD